MALQFRAVNFEVLSTKSGQLFSSAQRVASAFEGNRPAKSASSPCFISVGKKKTICLVLVADKHVL
jgi:hypothetical protein